jgi:membrane protease YdiL (CAAX protease family)
MQNPQNNIAEPRKNVRNAPLLLLVILLTAIAVTCVVGPILKIAIDHIIYYDISSEQEGAAWESVRNFARDHLDYNKKKESYDFSKIVLVILELILITLALLSFRKLRLSERFIDCFSQTSGWRRFFVWGFILGCLSLALYLAVLSWLGIYHFKVFIESFGSFLNVLAVSLVSAIIIGVLEETLFRAFLLQMFKEKMNILLAVFFSSLIYALLHFYNSDYDTQAGVDIFIVPKVLISLAKPMFDDPIGLSAGKPFLGIIPEAVGLLLVGVVLAFSFLKSRSIYLPIGIHAGWVFIIKMRSCFFQLVSGELEWLYGGKYLVTGVLSWACLGLVLLLILFGVGDKQAMSRKEDRMGGA